MFPATNGKIYPGISNGLNPYIVHDFVAEYDGDMYFYIYSEANFAPDDKNTIGFHTVKIPN